MHKYFTKVLDNSFHNLEISNSELPFSHTLCYRQRYFVHCNLNPIGSYFTVTVYL